MNDRMIQCPNCQHTFMSSELVDGRCPECLCANLIYGFVYISDKNELIGSAEDLLIPEVISFKAARNTL